MFKKNSVLENDILFCKNLQNKKANVFVDILFHQKMESKQNEQKYY